MATLLQNQQPWPELCGCCEQCVPSCLCSFFCFPCFAPQVGSHAGWNPNWGGCHQNGPRPRNLCSNIAVKFMTIFVASVIIGSISGGFTQMNTGIATANMDIALLKCLWDVQPSVGSAGTLNDENQCSLLGPPCAWGVPPGGSTPICSIPTPLLTSMATQLYTVGYIGRFFSGIQGLLQIWLFVLLFFLRRHIRQLFPSRQDECCMDCVCTFFCMPCTLSQEARLVFKYNQNPQFANCMLSDPGPMNNTPLGSQEHTVTKTTVVTSAAPVVVTATATPVVATATATPAVATVVVTQ